MSTYKELLQYGSRLLKEKEIPDSDLDAWYLLSETFGLSRMDYLLHGDGSADEKGARKYMEDLNRRTAHIPLQHITGTQEFMGLEFHVTPDVLIPRQDTELLTEELLKFCEGKSILDVCTGSGCIIIAAAKLGKPLKTLGVDISDKAIAIAAENAARHEVTTQFIQSDLFERVQGSFDIIVSNPPYIPTGDIAELMPEVKNHEPRIALDGDEDGLSFYRRISHQAKKYLKDGGWLMYEIGYNQGEAVERILDQEGFSDIVVKKDYSGHDRVVIARKK